MDAKTKEQLTEFRDSSPRAVSRRIKAALAATGVKQTDIATFLGSSIQTINSQIIAGRPSNAVMRFFYENHRIDFNFILYGDVLQLPVGVQDKLLAILADQTPT